MTKPYYELNELHENSHIALLSLAIFAVRRLTHLRSISGPVGHKLVPGRYFVSAAINWAPKIQAFTMAKGIFRAIRLFRNGALPPMAGEAA